MANSYVPETLPVTAATNRLQIATLISGLTRSMAFLTADIEHEEAQTGVHDALDPTYSVLARSLRARRANIGATIASLEALMPSTSKAA